MTEQTEQTLESVRAALERDPSLLFIPTVAELVGREWPECKVAIYADPNGRPGIVQMTLTGVSAQFPGVTAEAIRAAVDCLNHGATAAEKDADYSDDRRSRESYTAKAKGLRAVAAALQPGGGS